MGNAFLFQAGRRGGRLFSALLGMVLIAAATGRSGESAASPLLSRQDEILRQLENFRLADAATDGVWMLGRWDTDAGLDELVEPPQGGGNAAAHFRRLEVLYPSEKAALEQGGEDTEGVIALLAAAEVAECRLSPDYYPAMDRTDVKQPEFVVMRTYLQALLKRAERAERLGNRREAERCYRAALICGRHLTGDKSSVIVYMTGIIFKFRGVQDYENFLRRDGQADRAESAKKYAAHLTDVLRAFHWKANVALNEFDGFASLPAVIRVATDDEEVCWRKEAVVRLGIFRLGAPDKDPQILQRNPGLEKNAADALAKVASTDPDPSVRRLAVWTALNIKPENLSQREHRF